MLFSIVIALYNKSAYIGTTLHAVLAQSYKDFEIIVVDDGSTDDSVSIVRGIADNRIRLLQQANGGVSVARNAGIAAASGDWVAFLDADDIWRVDYLATQAATIKSHPEVDVVATGHHAASDLSEWVAHATGSEPSELQVEVIADLPRRWQQQASFFTSSVAVRTSTLKSMQPCFAPGESIGEDLDLWFRLGEAGPVAFVPAKLTGYRQAVPGSLTGSRKMHVPPPYLRRMGDRAKTGKLTPEQARSALWYIWNDKINAARHCIEIGNRKTALYWVMKTTPTGLLRVRWWVTLVMLPIPGNWVSHWNVWRAHRARRGHSANRQTSADPG